jgi:hypothetical protein
LNTKTKITKQLSSSNIVSSKIASEVDILKGKTQSDGQISIKNSKILKIVKKLNKTKHQNRNIEKENNIKLINS